jgi:hypothetical protein
MTRTHVRAAFGAALAAALAAAALSAGPASAATPVTLFVDGQAAPNGDGTAAKPLRAIGDALDRAHPGDTVHVAGGQYSAGKNFYGETRLRVPAGVTLEGEADAAKGRTIILGSAGETGVVMDGDGTVKNLLIAGFDIGLRASRGQPNLVGVDFSRNRTGIDLAGTAFLHYSASVADPNAGERGGIFTNLEGSAIRLHQSGAVDMQGGVIKGKAGCDPNQRGIDARNASVSINVKGTRFLNVTGGAVLAGFGSQVGMDGSTVSTAIPAGCTPAPAFLAQGALQLKNSTVENTGTRGGVAIEDHQSVSFNLSGVTMRNWGTGIQIADNAVKNVNLTSSTIDNSERGIDARTFPNANVKVTGSKLRGNDTAIEAATLTLRSSTLTGNPVGAVVMDGFNVDLGTVASPGKNTIKGNGILGSVRSAVGAPPFQLLAVGNTWDATQGADSAGHYPAGTVVSTGEFNGIGSNFRLETAGQSIRLG